MSDFSNAATEAIRNLFEKVPVEQLVTETSYEAISIVDEHITELRSVEEMQGRGIHELVVALFTAVVGWSKRLGVSREAMHKLLDYVYDHVGFVPDENN